MSLIKKGQCIKLSMLTYDEYLAVVQHLREEANNDYRTINKKDYHSFLSDYLGIDRFGDLEEYTYPYSFLGINEWQKAPYKDLKDHDYPNILYREEVTDLLLKIQYKKPVAHISDLEIVQKALRKAANTADLRWVRLEFFPDGSHTVENPFDNSCIHSADKVGDLLSWAKQTLENNHDRT